MATSGMQRWSWTAAALWLLAVFLLAATAGIALAQESQTPNQTPSQTPSQAPTSPTPSPTPPAAAVAPAPQAPDVSVLPTPQTPQSPTPATAELPPQPPPVDGGGFLSGVRRSFADFNAKMKDARRKLDEMNKQQADAAKQAAAATQEAMKNAADATKKAATAVVRWPNTRVIEIRETCAAAGNGAPDCETAANKACRGKGFETGQPVDVRTADKCPASLWISGQVPAAGQCPTETVVLRAVCQ